MCDQDRPLCELNEFKAFLAKCLNRNILSYKLRPLTKPGDNYGSIMQSVDVEVAGGGLNNSEMLHLVCKSAVTNPYLIEVFQPSFSFMKETYFYSDIIPALEQFEIAADIPELERLDIFIRSPGSRISLDPNAKCADADAALLLENIKYLNYTSEDRHQGFDVNTTLAILKELAHFHALCIAIRRLEPELFHSKIEPYMKAVNLNPDEDDSKFLDSFSNDLHFVDALDSQMHTAVMELFKVCLEFSRDTTRAKDTPYTTIVHRDLWTNNIMIKRDDVKNSTQVKIYDFQLYFYQSFACDLIFFLFSSVRCDELAKYFKMFIYHYHLEFLKTMKMLKCPREDYTYDKMWKEIQDMAKMELPHALFMAKIVTADDSITPSSLDEVTPDTFLFKKSPSKELLIRWNCIFKLFKENGLFEFV